MLSTAAKASSTDVSFSDLVSGLNSGKDFLAGREEDFDVGDRDLCLIDALFFFVEEAAVAFGEVAGEGVFCMTDKQCRCLVALVSSVFFRLIDIFFFVGEKEATMHLRFSHSFLRAGPSRAKQETHSPQSIIFQQLTQFPHRRRGRARERITVEESTWIISIFPSPP